MDKPLIHFSIGSAATNTHLSTDIPLDENAANTLQDVMELWAKTTIFRKNHLDARMKQ
jgi:hypothetical protein